LRKGLTIASGGSSAGGDAARGKKTASEAPISGGAPDAREAFGTGREDTQPERSCRALIEFINLKEKR
jgi:hypothetical protein